MSLRFLAAEEREAIIKNQPPFFDFVRKDVVQPFEGFIASVVRPALFKVGEKILRRSRLITLKTETLLHRLSDYFHGRRVAIKNGNGPHAQQSNGEVNGNNLSVNESNGNGNGNGNSKNAEFWNEMREAKNGLKNGGDGREKDDSQK